MKQHLKLADLNIIQDEKSPSAGEAYIFIKMGTYLSYIRFPALASSLVAALASALLYFKQK